MNNEEPNGFSKALIEHFENKSEFLFSVCGNYRGDRYSTYKISVKNCANFMVAKVRAAWLASKLYGTHYNHVFKRLPILFLFLILCSCSGNPYWAVYRNDGLEKKMYLKQGWPRDHKCTAYVNNRPIKRSTWANQFYYRPKKVKL